VTADAAVSAVYQNVVTPQNTAESHHTRMSRIFHPLMYLLACATRQELARQVQYLKVENEILRS